MLRHLGVGEERAFFLLRYQYGFKEIEIAGLYGLTESRICQRLAGIHERLQHIVRASERLPEERDSSHGEIADSKADQEATEGDYSFELDRIFAE